jgi:hypothetical protein
VGCNEGGIALGLAGADTNGHAFLKGVTVTGEVLATGANIGGQPRPRTLLPGAAAGPWSKSGPRFDSADLRITNSADRRITSRKPEVHQRSRAAWRCSPTGALVRE